MQGDIGAGRLRNVGYAVHRWTVCVIGDKVTPAIHIILHDLNLKGWKKTKIKNGDVV